MRRQSDRGGTSLNPSSEGQRANKILRYLSLGMPFPRNFRSPCAADGGQSSLLCCTTLGEPALCELRALHIWRLLDILSRLPTELKWPDRSTTYLSRYGNDLVPIYLHLNTPVMGSCPWISLRQLKTSRSTVARLQDITMHLTVLSNGITTLAMKYPRVLKYRFFRAYTIT